MSSEGEDTVGRRTEKKIMMQRASSDFNIAVYGTPLLSKKSLPKKVRAGSEDEITERNDERSESSGGEMQMGIENEFSKSFRALVSP